MVPLRALRSPAVTEYESPLPLKNNTHTDGNCPCVIVLLLYTTSWLHVHGDLFFFTWYTCVGEIKHSYRLRSVCVSWPVMSCSNDPGQLPLSLSHTHTHTHFPRLRCVDSNITHANQHVLLLRHPTLAPASTFKWLLTAVFLFRRCFPCFLPSCPTTDTHSGFACFSRIYYKSLITWHPAV